MDGENHYMFPVIKIGVTLNNPNLLDGLFGKDAQVLVYRGARASESYSIADELLLLHVTQRHYKPRMVTAVFVYLVNRSWLIPEGHKRNRQNRKNRWGITD